MDDKSGASAWKKAFAAARTHDDKYTCAQLLHILAAAIRLTKVKLPPCLENHVVVPNQWTGKPGRDDIDTVPKEADWVYQGIWCCKKAANILLSLRLLEAQRPILKLLRQIGEDQTFQRHGIHEVIENSIQDAIDDAKDKLAVSRGQNSLKEVVETKIETAIKQLFQRQLASLEASVKLIQLDAEMESPIHSVWRREKERIEMPRLKEIRKQLGVATEEIREWFRSNKWPEEGLPIRPDLYEIFVSTKNRALRSILKSIQAVPLISYGSGE